MSDLRETRSATTQEDVLVIDLGAIALPERVPELRWQLRSAMTSGITTVVVDMRDVTELSAEMMSSLLSAHRVCRIRGGRVELRCCERPVLDLLYRTALWRVFGLDLRIRSADTGAPA